MVRVAALWLNKLRSALRNRFYSVPFVSVAGGAPIAASEALTGSSSSAAPGPFQRGFACLLPLVPTHRSFSFFFFAAPPVVADFCFRVLFGFLGVVFLVLALLKTVKVEKFYCLLVFGVVGWLRVWDLRPHLIRDT